MIRNIKMLGLAVLAVLAVGAVAGSAAASAATDVFTSESAPYTLTGSQTEKHKFTVTSGLAVECGVANFHATVASTATSDIVTSVPEYKECTFNKEPATVTMNGCTYTFSGETVGEHLVTKLLCPAGSVVAIDVPSISCTMTVAPQTTSKGVKPTNQGTGTTRDVLLDITAGTVISHDGSGLACSLTGTTATYSGTATITGETDGGTTHVGVFVS